MNEEEMIQRKKIEKREKTDTILAYILIIILIACIGIILYLKFIREGDSLDNGNNEHINNTITLEQIADSLNNSLLVKTYSDDGATFSSSTSDNLLVVSYIKGDTNISMNMPLNANELVVTLNSDNSLIGEDIYKEIAAIVCMYYGNEENACRNTLTPINTNSVIGGIRFSQNGDDTIVYIDLMNSIDINNESTITYNEVTKVGIEETNYTLNLENETIENININSSDTELSFSGSIKTSLEEGQQLGVVVKLYGSDDNVIGEDKYSFEGDNLLEKEGEFTVKFALSDTLKLEDITSYSIEITR